MFAAKERIFFIGIGGAGMAPLALYVKQMGHFVSGVDDELDSIPAQLLKDADILLDASGLENASICVYSSAITVNHPYYKAAQAKGILLLRRGAFLARCAADKKLIAVVGSHGKTTTTAWIVHLLRQAGSSYDYILGGFFQKNIYMPSSYVGSDWLIAEIDESDGTIAAFDPEITVIVNFDWDHVDQYATQDALETVFLELFQRTRSLVLIPETSSVLKNLAQKSNTYFKTFGVGGDFCIDYLTMDIDRKKLCLRNQIFDTDVKGAFNAQNALVAGCVLNVLNVALSENSFKKFPGVFRRQEILFQTQDTCIIADYAHHPTEIAAFLDYCIHSKDFPKPIIAVFQPHRYTRTKQFYKAFAAVLTQVDEIHLLPVYAASEPFDPNGTTDLIYSHLRSAYPLARFHYWTDQAKIKAYLHYKQEHKGSLLLIGAGDIYYYADSSKTNKILKADPDVYLRSEATLASKLQYQLKADTSFFEKATLADKTTFKVEGYTEFFAEPCDLGDLLTLLKNTQATKTPYFLLGRGSNVLVTQTPFPGLIIRLSKPFWKTIERLDEQRIRVQAGVRLQQLCAYACQQGMGGFEFLEGIPGSVGGALRMNAGAMGSWMFDTVESVEFVSADGTLHHLPKSDFSPTYRNCPELHNKVATGAILKAATTSTPEAIKKILEAFTAKRRSTQPREASAGSVFKNPQPHYAAQLIESAGLKGLSEGNAQVSLVHANFIVNKGGATAQEVSALIEKIRNHIYQKSGVLLELEVVVLKQHTRPTIAN
jgi:UDP-N-acetylmuramate--alanine ligase